jgi:hypothetical protein
MLEYCERQLDVSFTDIARWGADHGAGGVL